MQSVNSGFVHQGNGVLLPIKGYVVGEIRLFGHALPTLLFHQKGQPEAKIDLAAVILTLSQGATEHVLRWDQKTAYTTSQLTPFVELVECTVVEAFAGKSGALSLALSRGFSLRAVPDVWEGWHFSWNGVTLHGDDGRLI